MSLKVLVNDGKWRKCGLSAFSPFAFVYSKAHSLAKNSALFCKESIELWQGKDIHGKQVTSANDV